MKKIFVCFAALAAMVFIVGCGGGSSNDENNDITCTVVADKTWTDIAESMMTWEEAKITAAILQHADIRTGICLPSVN